ncbi:hypothetical protein E2C01_022312 [Portunus trituberculatus]|uniref:Uncharacterized protein n=1 Tax=Portunus trituberculatus TaxID=210409 RepID=A0A5B7E8K5_PORTR|nr:hypothetical protein [Portunus trituberculatus]
MARLLTSTGDSSIMWVVCLLAPRPRVSLKSSRILYLGFFQFFLHNFKFFTSLFDPYESKFKLNVIKNKILVADSVDEVLELVN